MEQIFCVASAMISIQNHCIKLSNFTYNNCLVILVYNPHANAAAKTNSLKCAYLFFIIIIYKKTIMNYHLLKNCSYKKTQKHNSQNYLQSYLIARKEKEKSNPNIPRKNRKCKNANISKI